MRDDNQVSITGTVHVPYEYDHMFGVIAATLSESLYDHLALGGILLYIRYKVRSVLFVTHWRSPTVRRLLLDICRHVS